MRAGRLLPTHLLALDHRPARTRGLVVIPCLSRNRHPARHGGEVAVWLVAVLANSLRQRSASAAIWSRGPGPTAASSTWRQVGAAPRFRTV